MSARKSDQRPKQPGQEANPAVADAEAAQLADVAEEHEEAEAVMVGEAHEASATPTDAEEVAAATYDVYLEEMAEGVTLALILDLPGCYASGASRQDALDQLQEATAAYHAWLRRHDDYAPEVHGPFVFAVKEVFQVTAYEGGPEVHGFFAPDAETASDEDIEWALTLLGWQREDILEKVSALSDAALDWTSAEVAERQSIRQVLDHIAQAEVWYMGRLDETPPTIAVSALAGTTLERFERVRQAAVMRVKSYPKELRGKVFTHQGERWTLRKALRRAVWHERDHISEIDALLAGYGASH